MLYLFFLSLLLTVGAETSSATEDTENSVASSPKPLECGVSSQPLSEDPKGEGEITRGQFPWLAAIYRLDNGTWTYTCSGTLVSSHIVLTAAHCLLSPDEDAPKPEEIKIGLGKHNFFFESNEADSIIADVRELVTSNRFRGPDANYAFDVAILDLAVSLKPTPYINPACLLGEEAADINLDGKGYIASWCDNKNESHSSKVAFFYHPICLQKLPNAIYNRYLTPEKLCAEHLTGKEADRGSGGAGLTTIIKGAHYVVGILSTKVPKIVLLTDLKYEDIVKWVMSEKTRLDALHQ